MMRQYLSLLSLLVYMVASLPEERNNKEMSKPEQSLSHGTITEVEHDSLNEADNERKRRSPRLRPNKFKKKTNTYSGVKCNRRYSNGKCWKSALDE